MTTKRTRKPRAILVEQAEQPVAKAAAPQSAAAMGGGQRLSSAMIGGVAPTIGSAMIGGATCTLR